MKPTRKLLVLAAGVVGGIGVATTSWAYWTSYGTGTASATVGTWKTNTSTAVTSSANPSVVGQAVTYTAAVTASGSGSPTGNVEFFDGSTPISGCGGTTGVPLSGSSAVCSQTYAAVGTHSITAQYLGDANFNASPLSSTLTQTVNQAATSTSLTVTGSPATYGSENAVVFTSTVTAASGTPTGTVAINQAGTTLCSITLPSTTCSPSATALNAAPTAYSITAVYSGDSAYLGSTSAAQNLTVNKAKPVVTWPMPNAITYGTALSATQLNATADAPGTFAYSPAAGSALAAGSHGLTVVFTPTDTSSYEGTTAGVTLIVNKATLTVTAAPASRAYGAANPTFTPSYSGFQNGETSSVLTGTPFLTTSATTTSPVGTYPIDAAAGSLFASNYTFAFTPASLTVVQASTSTSLAISHASVAFGNEFVETFTAAVTPQFSGTPSGTVTVNTGGITLCSMSLPMTTCSLTSVQLTPATYSSVTATYSGDTNFAVSSSSPSLSFTVTNGKLHISILTGSAANQNANFWRATATVNVQDASGNPVSGVAVVGSWNPSDNNNSCTTGANGQCSIVTGNLARGNVANATWAVSSLTKPNYTYDPAANSQSSVVIARPA